MAIVNSSYIVENHTQIDGRRYVYETFFDAEGNIYNQTYLADVNANYDEILAEHTSQLSAKLENN